MSTKELGAFVAGVAVGVACQKYLFPFARKASGGGSESSGPVPKNRALAPKLPKSPFVSGLFEVCIGVPLDELEAHIEYWEQFGFYEASDLPRGHFNAKQSKELYGVQAESLTSVRLFHGNADHGLVRLMCFKGAQPKCPSWKLTNLRVKGARWGAQLTDDLFNIHNHASDSQAEGLEVRCGEPQRCIIYKDSSGGAVRPFVGKIACVRELLVIQPTAVSNFYQRYDYKIPKYGQPANESKFKASQITHCGLTVQGPPEVLNFYEDALGLMRQPDRKVEFGPGPEPTDESTRVIMGLVKPGDFYVTTNFDDPRSSTNVQDYRSGRLHIQRFPEGVDMPDMTKEIRPGCIGPCLYTLRAQNAAAVRARVSAAKGSEVTCRVMPNEFGEPSFSFVSPDGYAWNALQA